MNGSVTKKLVDFIISTEFEDIPNPVIHEAKRVLLDSIACALGGITTVKGRLGIAWAKRLGGIPEASILGMGDRLSCTSAAFANGELINALDYDAILVGSHITPFIIPAALALSEKVKSTGKNLITAVAIGHEIAARMAIALTWLMNIDMNGEGKVVTKFPPVYGYSQSVFGGIAAACKILKFNENKTKHAFGIVGSIAPVNSMVKWWNTPPAALAKYLMAGWVAQTEITAALLAHAGYTGISDILDGEDGFWKYSGSLKWEPEKVIKDLGREWYFEKIEFKPYPCCKAMHTALDCLIEIIEKNDLRPENIEKILIWLSPQIELPIWKNEDIITEIDAQFSMPYIFSAAALRISHFLWQEWLTIEDIKIKNFMKYIKCFPHPEFGLKIIEDANSRLAKVEIITRDGGRLSIEKKYPKGSHFDSSLRMSDKDLECKFRYLTTKFLTLDQINKCIEFIFEIEKKKKVSELMDLICLKNELEI